MPVALPRWVAHRGGGNRAPENTLAGIRLAARCGFAAVEFDVMLSGDGTPFLMHDDTLERTTNGHGRCVDTADAVLFSLDAGGGEPPPRLLDALALCRDQGLLANVELKAAAGEEERSAAIIVRQLGEFCRATSLPVLVSAFSLAALAVARDLAPELPRGWLFEAPTPDWPETASRLALASLHCAADRIAGSLIEQARARGLALLAYTVNDPVQAEMLFSRGVGALCTDRLGPFAGETFPYQTLQSAC